MRWMFALALVVAGCSGAPGGNDAADYEIVGSPRAPDETTPSPAADESTAPVPVPSSSSRPAPPPPDLPVIVNGDFSAGFDGWSSSGDKFTLFTGTDGKPRVTTYVKDGLGDGAVGKLWQDFTVGASNTELRFLVHGGDARVVLLHGDEVIASIKGSRTNDDQAISWNVSELRGKRLRVMIDDSVKDPWGFVGAGLFEVR